LKICLVVPAYNEERRISPTLDGFITLLKRYSGLLIIVSVQGNDGTADIVKRYAKKYHRIRLLDARGTLGKGRNLMQGFGAALKLNPDVVGFADADVSVSPRELTKLIDAMEDSELKAVIASRYMKGSRIIGDMKASRLFASRAHNLMVRILFGLNLSDTQCGAKLFRASALRSIMRDFQLTDMSFDTNLLYEMSRRDLKIKEIPITYRIVNEDSKVQVWKQIPKMFTITLSYRITRSPLNSLFPPKFKLMMYNWVKEW
jgi:dolichyl-phosphate beta-glucosyltransferase